MAIILFLSNGPLQQVVQPVVYGATLGLNPLVVFSVTIAAGTLFGIAGMVLAAPLISGGGQRTPEDLHPPDDLAAAGAVACTKRERQPGDRRGRAASGWTMAPIASRVGCCCSADVSLYLLAPKLMSVLTSWPQLKTLKPGWFALAVGSRR